MNFSLTPQAATLASFCLAVLTPAASLDPWGRREYPNLLHNRSFEAWPHQMRPDVATTWFCKEGASRDTNGVARTGRAALKFAGKGEAGHHLFLPPDTEYEFRVFRRGEGDGLKLVVLAANRRDPLGEIAASGNSESWSELKLKVRTPPQKVPRFTVVIRSELAADKTAWVDDASFAPADGKLGETPAPTVEPEGGTFDGPTYVTLKTDFPGGTVRFTLDGEEPDPFSMVGDLPIRIAASCMLKAKVFHDAFREGPTTEAKFEIKPTRPTTGVPHYPIRLGQPVEEWWKGHAFNPASPGFVKDIASPEPRVSVADVRDKHPETTTAGIEEALAQLPAGGGTLWFPKARGPYVIAKPARLFRDYYESEPQIAVAKRSNVHLLSDGAEIRGGGPALFTVASMEYAEKKTMQRPVTNWLARGLVFDGQGTAHGAFEFYHTHDVLIEDCEFRHFTKGRRPDQIQVVLARAQCENVWVRRCRFESGVIGVLYDGVFNGGVLDSRFGPGVTMIPVSSFPNTDMGIPPRMLSPLLRPGRYLVIAGNTFDGPAKSAPGHLRAIDLVATETLVTGNRAKNLHAFICFKSPGLPPHNWPHRWPTGGLRVTGNTVENLRLFAMANWGLEGDAAGRGHVFERNTGTLTDAVLEVASLFPGEIVEGITFRNNQFIGAKRALLAKPDVAGRVRRVSIDGEAPGKP